MTPEGYLLADGQTIVHDRLGKTLRLEYAGYWRIASDHGGSVSSSGFAQDEQAARAAWEEITASLPCRECGEHPSGRWTESCMREMRERQLCFDCNSWTNTLAKITPDHLVIAGSLYRIGESEQSIARRCSWPIVNGRLAPYYQHVLGHGGAEFIIRYHDGRLITTTNLWAGGPIPDHFRERLPDNAEFESREESYAYVGHGSASV